MSEDERSKKIREAVKKVQEQQKKSLPKEVPKPLDNKGILQRMKNKLIWQKKESTKK